MHYVAGNDNIVPPKWIVLNKDKATTQLQMFLKPTTPVLTPQGLDIYVSGIAKKMAEKSRCKICTHLEKYSYSYHSLKESKAKNKKKK